MPESGKSSMRAEMAFFWSGVIVFIRFPNKYLYEPSSKVCRHSTGVLLYTFTTIVAGDTIINLLVQIYRKTKKRITAFLYTILCSLEFLPSFSCFGLNSINLTNDLVFVPVCRCPFRAQNSINLYGDVFTINLS